MATASRLLCAKRQPGVRSSGATRRCAPRAAAPKESIYAPATTTTPDASAALLDMFERAASPMGTWQRAEAALAAARAMAESDSRDQAGGGGGVSSTPAPAPRTAASSSSAGARDGSGGRRGGGGQAAASGAVAANAPAPGPSFWEWSPPVDAPRPSELQMQRAPAPYVRTAAPLKEAVVSPPLPPLQSVAEAPAWQEALLASMAVASPPTAAGGAMTASPLGEIATGGAATTAAPLFSQQAFAAAAEAAPASGVRADGTRWWSESGTEEREAGRRVTWTAIKCVSPDGATEWQEKWWSASDKFAYKEMGAEKSGRASDGRVWREAWTEVYAPDPMTGLGHIVRSADKWATGSDGSKWHEAWDEQHWADGGTLRSADKWGRVAPGVIPEDGHASEWRERWGEAWDGKGGASKWADKTASRDEREGGGASRRWGDKWTQEFRAGVGGRWGESWSDDPEGGGWYSRKWAEDHYGDGSGLVRKWGEATDGERWEDVQHEATWYEGKPNFGWEEAIRHSPQLMAVPPRQD